MNHAENCFVFGWQDFWVSGARSEFSKFSVNLWTRLRARDSLYEAINYAKSHATTEGTQDPREEYRVHGVGDMFNFKL